MTGQTDHADIMGEVLAAELRSETDVAGSLKELLLQLDVAEGAAEVVTGGRQVVVVFGRGELYGLEVGLSRGAAYDECDMIGRAGRSTEGPHLLDQETLELLGVEQGLGLLKEEGLIGRTAALGYEQELVLSALGGIDVHLCREVVAGVLLLVHVQGNGLGITEIVSGIGIVDSVLESLLVADAGAVGCLVHPHLAALLGHHDSGAGILAERQFLILGHVGIESLVLASGSLRILATISLCSGRSMKATSWKAWRAMRRRPSGSTFRISSPSNWTVDT